MCGARSVEQYEKNDERPSERVGRRTRLLRDVGCGVGVRRVWGGEGRCASMDAPACLPVCTLAAVHNRPTPAPAAALEGMAWGQFVCRGGSRPVVGGACGRACGVQVRGLLGAHKR